MLLDAGTLFRRLGCRARRCDAFAFFYSVQIIVRCPKAEIRRTDHRRSKRANIFERFLAIVRVGKFDIARIYTRNKMKKMAFSHDCSLVSSRSGIEGQLFLRVPSSSRSPVRERSICFGPRNPTKLFSRSFVNFSKVNSRALHFSSVHGICAAKIRRSTFLRSRVSPFR